MRKLTQICNFLVIVCFSELILAELSSGSESIQPGLINLGRSNFEFDLAHVKYRF